MSKTIFLRRDRSGAIEGLPLQLMIAVIVAGIALAIILGWVLSIQTPNAISKVEVDPESVSIGGFSMGETATKVVSFTVRAYDQKGNPIPGTAVSLQGAGASVVRLDGADGTDGAVAFPNVEVRILPGQLTATVLVTVEVAGYPTETGQVLVVRE